MLLAHLLKLHLRREHMPHDVARAGRGWWHMVRAHRVRVQGTLVWSRTLRTELPQVLADAYAAARLEAARDLPVAESLVPATCPWTLEEVLEATWCAERTEETRP